MNLDQRNTAYDMSLFEVNKVKDINKDNILELPKDQLKQKKQLNIASVMFTSLLAFLSIAVVGIMIFNQVQLTEITDKTRILTQQLEESYSENTQLQMKVKEKLSPVIVEEYAKNNLSMEKINPCQVEYFSLSPGDKAEKVQNDNKSVLDKILTFVGIR